MGENQSTDDDTADKGGEPGRKPRVTDEELVTAIAARCTPKNPVVTTVEIVDVVPLKTRAVQLRLNKLHEAGAIRAKDVGARGRVWWPPRPEAVPEAFREAVKEARAEID